MKLIIALMLCLPLVACEDEAEILLYNPDPASVKWAIKTDTGCGWCYAYVCKCIDCDDLKYYHWQGMSRTYDVYALGELVMHSLNRKDGI